MGAFRVKASVSSPADPNRSVDVGELLVDTGSELSWIEANRLREAGIAVRKPAQRFTMANGDTIERDIGYAVIRSGEFETNDEVVFARDGDLHLLGVRTLEGFNATVDAVRKRLVAAGPIPAA